MRSEEKQPGIGPARKRKQHSRSHCSGGKVTAASGASSTSAGFDVIRNIKHEVKVYKTTALYLRGRDLTYPDEAALNRFNAWVVANQDEIDPAEQFVCGKCGHVDFQLCAHKLREVPPPPTPEDVVLVSDDMRHHRFGNGMLRNLLKTFSLPRFDTHSIADDKLNGFSNDYLPDGLVIIELYNYLVVNMQTSYLVNGAEDRALKLSHVHRLAQRWAINNEFEKKLERDLHLCVRFRLTIQRACDNAQNEMLYGHRDPKRNFGLAWLPRSRVRLAVLFFLVVMALYHCSTTMGLLMRVWEIAAFAGSATLYLLNCVAASVPDLVPRILVSVSAHPSGNGPGLQCVSTSTGLRWHAAEDALAVTQSCQFTDWVMAGSNEVSYRIWENSANLYEDMMRFRGEKCVELRIRRAILSGFWAAHEVDEALGSGLLTAMDVLRLWAQMVWSEILFCLYRC